ncbi:MAG: twin-arginine translocase subunit TatC [Candidatus Omnitrophota bacterium]
MQDKQQTVVEHLQELRTCIIKSLISIIIGAVVIYQFVPLIFKHLIRPAGKLVFIAPQEAFVTNLKIAFFGGIFVSLPFIFFQIWRFVSRGLQPNEKKYALFFGPVSLLFFVIGAGFGYFLIVPVGVKFLLGYATEFVVPMLTVSRYVSFVCTLTLAFGFVFQLPLVSMFLTKIGVVTPTLLSNKRKYAVVAVFVLAAVITPPDVVTQALMAVPLIILYEIGILFSRFVYKSA